MNNKAPKEHSSVNRHQATCTKTDRDYYRICPSKLSRRELENLYFSLLENNVDLKKTLNLQQEKLKTLSAKVQRLSYPRNSNGAGKDSPVSTAMVKEQKESIIQLKSANERMAEKIRVLNMKLCSVKQFVGKNKASSHINATLSSSNTKSNCTSSANLVTAGPSFVKTNSVGTETDYFAERYSNSSCDITCKPTMVELNEKINNLQEELQISRQRIEKLEALIMRLQGENQTIRSERAISEHALHQQDAKLDNLKDKLRCAEAKVNDMNMELTIEKKKIAELETELKLAGNIGNILSSSNAKTIEEIEQKNVGGEANAPTDEAKLIRDEVNVASDEVQRAQDKVHFMRGDVERNGVNRVPNDVEYNLSDVMARTEIYTDDHILTKGDKDVAINEVNKEPEERKNKQAEEHFTTKEVNKITGDRKLTKDEENVSKNEDIRAPDDFQFIRGEQINVRRNEVNRVPDDVEYNWGEYMSGTQLDSTAFTWDHKRLNNDELNEARNKIDKTLDYKSGAENNVTRNELDKVPSGIELTRGGENVARNDESTAPDDLKLKRGDPPNVTRNEVSRVPDDVEYNWEDLMAGIQADTVTDHERLNNDELNVARNEINRTLDNKSRDESNVTRNEVEKVPSGYTLTRGEEVIRNQDSVVPDDMQSLRGEVINMTKNEVKKIPDDKGMTREELNMVRDEVKKVPDDIELTSDHKNLEKNEGNRAPNNVEYNWDEKIIIIEVDISRIEVNNEKDEVKSPREDLNLKDDPGYMNQQDLNKDIETEKDQRNIKFNQDLINKISELVSQLEMLKLTAAGEANTVTDKIIKEKPAKFKPHDVKTKKPDAISLPANKQKLTQKSYEVKIKETDNTSSQAKKEKPKLFKSYEAKPKKADNISHPISKQNPTQYNRYEVNPKKPRSISSPSSINKRKPTGLSYDDKMKETDVITSKINKEKENQYKTYDGGTEATDNVSTPIDKPMKYESYDVKTEADDIVVQENKNITTRFGSEDDVDIESQMKEKLAEYEFIDIEAKKADTANAPKYKSYDFETKESDDLLPQNDTIDCILEMKSTSERNKFKIKETVSNNEVKEMSRDTEQKPINYPTIPVEDFDSSHEQIIGKLSTVGAQELKSKMIPKPPCSDDDPRYQIPGPVPVDLNDQKRQVSVDSRKSIDDSPEKFTDSYRKRPNKISYVEKSKQVGTISESLLKDIINEQTAISKDSYGESLRKRSLEEKSEKIRKTFCETPNRMGIQQSSEDNIRKPFRDLTARQSFDEKVLKTSDTDGGGRPVRKSKDPLSTRPSLSLTEKAVRISLDDISKESLPFDVQPRLSLSPKTASIIKDYARDVEVKSRKFKQRFSNPCATVIGPSEPSGFLHPTESILKSNDAATSSPCIKETGVNSSPSTSVGFNKEVGGYAPPPVGGQENAVIESPTTAAHTRDVDEPFEICGASAKVCVCPLSVAHGVSAFRTCTGNIRFRTTQPQDNIRHCACRAEALEHYDCEKVAGPSSRRDSGMSMDNKEPKTYSVADKHSRATSPDNTDHEISSMTDWASDKDRKISLQTSLEARTRSSLLSEERGTTTGTDVPSDHYTTASEGEVPGGLSSLGERDPGLGTYQGPQQQNLNKNDTMEATLQTITEELARCRKLLLSQRNQEKDKSVEHALRRAPASRQLSATYTPACVFTLHIGTLVLSDETVLWSRDKNLVLTWKFYSQSAAMTRVQPGRVAIFDFVTEYDVGFNDDMLNYMKNSEMALVLCELGQEEKPYAKCWLPLQEALLHANRRADMSLALLPCQTEDTDSREGFGEEIGVLDIWCSLRLDKSLLPVIDRAMHKPSNNVPAWHVPDPRAARESRIIQQAAEEEPSRNSSQSRQWHEFGLGRMSQQKRPLPMTVEVPRCSYSEYPTRNNTSNFYVPGQDIPSHAAERYAEETQEQQLLHQQPRCNFHSFSSPSQKAQLDYGIRGRGGYERWSTPEHQASGIIINEVSANIRTGNDLREALEQKVQQDNMTRLPKMEEYDSSLKHSSIGSVRSLVARHQLAKLKTPQKHKADGIATESFQDILNKDKQYVPTNMEGSDPNLSRSDNAYKYIGVPGINKLTEASRKSVKYCKAISRASAKGQPRDTAGPHSTQTIEITILWLALNEECEAMANPNIKQLYVAYSFLGRKGAELETPFSLPKPKNYADKCYFNFKKTFHLHEADLSLLGHMARCRSGGEATTDPQDCVVFTLVSEPPEDPLGLSSCEDVGFAFLYLGDVLAYSGGSNGYTEVIGVRGVRGGVCGVLAVRVDNLDVLRLCLTLQP